MTIKPSWKILILPFLVIVTIVMASVMWGDLFAEEAKPPLSTTYEVCKEPIRFTMGDVLMEYPDRKALYFILRNGKNITDERANKETNPRYNCAINDIADVREVSFGLFRLIDNPQHMTSYDVSIKQLEQHRSIGAPIRKKQIDHGVELIRVGKSGGHAFFFFPNQSIKTSNQQPIAIDCLDYHGEDDSALGTMCTAAYYVQDRIMIWYRFSSQGENSQQFFDQDKMLRERVYRIIKSK